MLLAGLIDLGLPLPALRSALRSVGLRPDGFRVERVRTAAGPACRVSWRFSPGGGDWREPARMLERIDRSGLPVSVRARAVRVVRRLQGAEGSVHRVPARRVRFVQLGRPDTLAAIVGFCFGLLQLRIGRVFLAPLPLGGRHRGHRGGWRPGPGPAVRRLLRGWPTVPREGGGEWVTPTAAALMTVCAVAGYPQPFRCFRFGFSAGHFPPIPGGGPMRFILAKPLSLQRDGT